MLIFDDKDCYEPHPRDALALLTSRSVFHGRDVLKERRTEITPLRRIIPLSDPRILGDAMNPTVFDETENADILFDREHGVVLEWRALFEGNVYERHLFTEIAFDVPLERSDFDIQVSWSS